MACVAVIGALLWFVKRRNSRAQVDGVEMEVRVLTRQPMGPKAHLCVVQVGHRTLLLGITESQVTHLGDLHPDNSTQPLHITRIAENARPVGMQSAAQPLSIEHEKIVPAFGPTSSPHIAPSDLSMSAYVRSLFRSSK